MDKTVFALRRSPYFASRVGTERREGRRTLLEGGRRGHDLNPDSSTHTIQYNSPTHCSPTDRDRPTHDHFRKTAWKNKRAEAIHSWASPTEKRQPRRGGRGCCTIAYFGGAYFINSLASLRDAGCRDEICYSLEEKEPLGLERPSADIHSMLATARITVSVKNLRPDKCHPSCFIANEVPRPSYP